MARKHHKLARELIGMARHAEHRFYWTGAASHRYAAARENDATAFPSLAGHNIQTIVSDSLIAS